MAEQSNLGIEQYDREEVWRCPTLGGPVHFGYCRKMNDGLPCAKLLECWLQRLPLVDFLKTHYSPDEIQTAFTAKRKGRLTRMLETIESASPDEAADPDVPRD
jgi:hypothetical protein